MLRLLIMGVVVPAIMLTSFAVWIGAVQIRDGNMPEPAILLLAAAAVGVVAVKRLSR